MSQQNGLFALGREWHRQEYATLVETALKSCRSFILVSRGDPSSQAHSLLGRLDPFLERAYSGGAWPGTRLLGSDRANIFKYDLNNDSASVLLQAVGSLWDWIGPACLEDLAFLRASGHPWFISITHERDAFFKLLECEKEVVEAAFGKGSLVYQCDDQCPDEMY